MSRRGFLSSAFFVTSGLGRRVGATSPNDPPPGRELARLRQLFGDPPFAARPLTRWWWFGGAVTPEEITRELTFMKEAGLRGAEIQPVYPVAVDDARQGIRHLRYFTEEWFEVLRHAVREARRLGMQLDFTLGSGWPYGGPFIPTALAARRLRVLTQDLVGPREFSWHLGPHLTGDERVVAVVAAPVGPDQQLDLGRSRVLSHEPRPETAGNTREDRWLRTWPIPEGEWRLLVVIDSPTGQQVKRPTLGMEGNVLDHHRREATALFLRAAGDRVMNALAPAGDPPFHSVFCDSLEVFGADWTPDLLKEFRARRGYDLAPFLPALWQDAGPPTPHVRYDYHLTLSDLTLDYFFRPLVEWSARRGLKARIQAHGALGDIMRGYGLADIPEGENIYLGDRYMVNLRHRRLASSAAHVYGKPVASSETYTWLRLPLFMGTLEMMKAATDSVFLDGLNHVVNHGYSYSPPLAGEPGWHFYAATEINHSNTWWRHYPHLARYVQRAQVLLQRGISVNPVAVYLPLADVYAHFGAGGLHVDVEIERRLGTELLTGLRHAGYDFDVVQDHALTAVARVEGGRLRAGTAEYAVVVVPGARFMPPESAARLAEFARQGGHVLFIERFPEAAPGWTDQEGRTAELKRTLGPGTGTLVADGAAALARLGTLLDADFRIVEAGDGGEAARKAAVENVGFVHRRDGAVDYYLVANVSGQGQDLRARFAVGHRAPERWEPETGARSSIAYEYVAAGGRPFTEVDLRLEPFASCFVVFDAAATRPVVTRTRLAGPLQITRNEIAGRAEANGEYTVTLASKRVLHAAVRDLPAPVAADGPWTLRLGQAAPIPLDHLGSWDELEAGRSFSGWGTYEAECDLAHLGTDVDWQIDLGEVHETAEVWLNGQSLGAAWKAPRRLACGEALRAGRNLLKVEVANLWIHHLATAPSPPEWKEVDETVGIRWGRYGEGKPEKMPPAGLLGPVRLVPVKRVRLSI